MKKVVRLTENDLIRIVKRVINEERYGSFGNLGRKKDSRSDEWMDNYDDEEYDDDVLGRKKDSRSDEWMDNYDDEEYDDDVLGIPDDMLSYKTKYEKPTGKTRRHRKD
jgi:LPS sulfotransferase NodH